MKNKDGLVRVGGVGTGRIFGWAHTKTYPPLWAKARLVGFYDKVPAQAQKAMGEYRELLQKYADAHPQAAESIKANLAELKCHDSLESLLKQVDGIDVCTHSRGRMEAALTAMKAGVHSMVEKPMARTWIEADRAVKAFDARPDVFCQLNDDNVYEPKYRVLHDVLEQGHIGRPITMTLIRGSKLSSTSVLRSQANGLENGGGCLMDYGTHGLAGAWYALGVNLRVVKVQAVNIGVLFPNRVLEEHPCVIDVDDNARVRFLLEDPATGDWATIYLEASWCGGHIGEAAEKPGTQAGGYIRVDGEEGFIDATAANQMVVTRSDGGQSVLPMRVYEGETISFGSEIEKFVDCVRTGERPAFDARFGAEIVAAVQAGYLSAVRKKAVTIEEFKEFCRGYVARLGDNEKAEEALLADLLAPYKPGVAK